MKTKDSKDLVRLRLLSIGITLQRKYFWNRFPIRWTVDCCQNYIGSLDAYHKHLDRGWFEIFPSLGLQVERNSAGDFTSVRWTVSPEPQVLGKGMVILPYPRGH